MEGIKHLIECHCILPQYRGAKNPVYHKFTVFSIIDDSDTVIPKYMQCNNCGAVHKVVDISRSEIITGKDELRSCTTIDDIKIGLKKDIIDILESYDCDLSTWENVKYILNNNKWGNFVVLSRDELDDEVHGKMLIFENKDAIKIEPFIMNRGPT